MHKALGLVLLVIACLHDSCRDRSKLPPAELMVHLEGNNILLHKVSTFDSPHSWAYYPVIPLCHTSSEVEGDSTYMYYECTLQDDMGQLIMVKLYKAYPNSDLEHVPGLNQYMTKNKSDFYSLFQPGQISSAPGPFERGISISVKLANSKYYELDYDSPDNSFEISNVYYDFVTKDSAIDWRYLNQTFFNGHESVPKVIANVKFNCRLVSNTKPPKDTLVLRYSNFQGVFPEY